ncbi:MAG: cytochrome b/b6 domain-containing protein [Parvibaculaceae bacterium]
MQDATVRVWDPAVRIFHWSLAASILAAWLTADEWKTVHIWAGYAAAVLIAFRLFWGFIGSRHARFSDFVRSPVALLHYLKDVVTRRDARYVGHNPAGGVMILALLLTVAAIATTGWMQTLDAFWGAEWLEELHETLANGLLVLIFLHIAGVILSSLHHSENLVLAMITGRKRAPDPIPLSPSASADRQSPCCCEEA